MTVQDSRPAEPYLAGDAQQDREGFSEQASETVSGGAPPGAVPQPPTHTEYVCPNCGVIPYRGRGRVTVKDTRPEVCGTVCECGPNREPLACGYKRGHDGPHAWATLPTFPILEGDPIVVRPSDSLAESQAGSNGPSGSPISPSERDPGGGRVTVQDTRQEFFPSPHPEIRSDGAEQLGREGMVTIWDEDGRIIGCMGVALWKALLTAGGGAA